MEIREFIAPIMEPAAVIASLEEYIKTFTPNGLAATVTQAPGIRPCRSPVDSPAVAAARRAMAPLVFLAVGLDADRIHAPNEYVDLSRLLKGAEATAYLWEELGAAGTGQW